MKWGGNAMTWVRSSHSDCFFTILIPYSQLKYWTFKCSGCSSKWIEREEPGAVASYACECLSTFLLPVQLKTQAGSVEEATVKTNWDQSAKPFRHAGSCLCGSTASPLFLAIASAAEMSKHGEPRSLKYCTAQRLQLMGSIDLFDTMWIYEAAS